MMYLIIFFIIVLSFFCYPRFFGHLSGKIVCILEAILAIIIVLFVSLWGFCVLLFVTLLLFLFVASPFALIGLIIYAIVKLLT